jgi:hypothetical protein
LLQTVGDSCDASGEYTTEEDEGEARSDFLGDSQQDLDSTLIASANTPTTPDQPKVTSLWHNNTYNLIPFCVLCMYNYYFIFLGCDEG